MFTFNSGYTLFVIVP